MNPNSQTSIFPGWDFRRWKRLGTILIGGVERQIDSMVVCRHYPQVVRDTIIILAEPAPPRKRGRTTALAPGARANNHLHYS
jgi:hypothetical protein